MGSNRLGTLDVYCGIDERTHKPYCRGSLQLQRRADRHSPCNGILPTLVALSGGVNIGYRGDSICAGCDECVDATLLHRNADRTVLRYNVVVTTAKYQAQPLTQKTLAKEICYCCTNDL